MFSVFFCCRPHTRPRVSEKQKKTSPKDDVKENKLGEGAFRFGRRNFVIRNCAVNVASTKVIDWWNAFKCMQGGETHGIAYVATVCCTLTDVGDMRKVPFVSVDGRCNI